jgi:hypothetical protein
MLAVISGTDSTVAVTSRMAYSRRSAGASGRRADDGAAGWRSVAQQRASRRVDGVAGQRLQLVQRAAGVAQAAAADHRHHGAAGGQHRRQHQADLVAHAAGAVLVEHRAGGVGPGSTSAESRHGRGQRHGFGGIHATQQDGHRHRAGLGVAPAGGPSGGQAVHEGRDLGVAQRAAVTLAADDLGWGSIAGPRAWLQFRRVMRSSGPGATASGWPSRRLQRVDVHHAGAASVPCFSSVKLSPPRPGSVDGDAHGARRDPAAGRQPQAAGHHALADGAARRPSCS